MFLIGARVTWAKWWHRNSQCSSFPLSIWTSFHIQKHLHKSQGFQVREASTMWSTDIREDALRNEGRMDAALILPPLSFPSGDRCPPCGRRRTKWACEPEWPPHIPRPPGTRLAPWTQTIDLLPSTRPAPMDPRFLGHPSAKTAHADPNPDWPLRPQLFGQCPQPQAPELSQHQAGACDPMAPASSPAWVKPGSRSIPVSDCSPTCRWWTIPKAPSACLTPVDPGFKSTPHIPRSQALHRRLKYQDRPSEPRI